MLFFFFSSRRRHTRYWRDRSSDVCSSDLAARFADELNLGWQDVAATATILDQGRAVIDREIVYSTAQVLCGGRTDAEFARRAEAIRQRPDELNVHGLAGTPAQVVDRIGRFAEHGI